MKTDISGCSAVVTGGGTGIGFAMAERLVGLGCSVVVCGRRGAVLEHAVERIMSAHPGASVGATAMAVTDEGKVEGFIRSLGVRGLDILVNAAGVVVNAELEKTPVEDFRRIMDINVTGAFLMSTRSLPLLRESPKATVINLCSASSHQVHVAQGAYSASKAALLSLTQTFALETYEEGIRTHAICPGAVATDMIEDARPDLGDIPMIAAEDIADTMEYLLTHRTNAVIDEIVVHRVSQVPWPY